MKVRPDVLPFGCAQDKLLSPKAGEKGGAPPKREAGMPEKKGWATRPTGPGFRPWAKALYRYGCRRRWPKGQLFHLYYLSSRFSTLAIERFDGGLQPGIKELVHRGELGGEQAQQRQRDERCHAYPKICAEFAGIGVGDVA